MIFIFYRFRLLPEFGNVFIRFIYLNRLERYFWAFKLILVIKENSDNPILLGSPLFMFYVILVLIFKISDIFADVTVTNV